MLTPLQLMLVIVLSKPSAIKCVERFSINTSGMSGGSRMYTNLPNPVSFPANPHSLAIEQIISNSGYDIFNLDSKD